MSGRTRGTVFMAALGLLLLTGGLAAHADTMCPARPTNPAAAKHLASRWWQQAVKHFQAGRDLPAIRAWRCAHRLSPHPLALYNIGRAAERAGKLALALQAYEAFFRAQPNHSKAAKVKAAIKRLRAKLPARARAQARPRRVAAQRPRVSARVHPRVRPIPEGVTQPAKPGPKSRRGRTLGIAGWTAVGTGVGLAALAGILGGLASREKHAVEDADFGTPYNPILINHADSYDRYRTGAWIAASVGSAALITGTVLLILGRKGRQAERVTLTPETWPGGGGLSLSGRF